MTNTNQLLETEKTKIGLGCMRAALIYQVYASKLYRPSVLSRWQLYIAATHNETVQRSSLPLLPLLLPGFILRTVCPTDAKSHSLLRLTTLLPLLLFLLLIFSQLFPNEFLQFLVLKFLLRLHELGLVPYRRMCE